MNIEAFFDKHVIGNGDGKMDFGEAFDTVWILGTVIGAIVMLSRMPPPPGSEDSEIK